MKQIRYIGQEDRVLIDVGTFEYGDTFTLNDEFADRLIASFPDSYEFVADDESATTEDEPAATEKPSKKSASADTTDATDATDATSTSTSTS